MFKNLADPQYVLKFQNLCGLRRGNSSGKIKALDSFQGSSEGKKGLATNHAEFDRAELHKRKHVVEEEERNFYETTLTKEAFRNQPEGELLYNRYIHSLYFFGSGLGDEIFYLTVFPVLFWSWDEYVMRRLVFLWVFAMYIGQGLKDILRWPRPPSPPVIVVERKYESEYGMPSTHAIVGSIVPFSLVFFSYGRYEFPWQAGLAFFVFWCGLVCLSRIYMGVHSFQDIVGGLCVSLMVTSIFLPFMREGAEEMLLSPYAGIYIILASIIMVVMYPSCDKWTRARGDTTRILCGGTGALLSSWIVFYVEEAPIPDPYEGAPYSLISVSLNDFIPLLGVFFAKFLIGLSIIIPVKLIFKFTMKSVLHFFIPNAEETLNKRLFVELTYIFVTYTAVGFAAIHTTPKMFHYFGI